MTGKPPYPGRVFRSDDAWVIEVPMLGVTTQGGWKHGALAMLLDAIESMVNRPGFEAFVDLGGRIVTLRLLSQGLSLSVGDEAFVLGSNDESALEALERAHKTREAWVDWAARSVESVPDVDRLDEPEAPGERRE